MPDLFDTRSSSSFKVVNSGGGTRTDNIKRFYSAQIAYASSGKLTIDLAIVDSIPLDVPFQTVSGGPLSIKISPGT